MPQDVKVSPDGKVFYIADMQSNGVWEIDGATFKKIGFVPTRARVPRALHQSRCIRHVRHQSGRGVNLID